MKHALLLLVLMAATAHGQIAARTWYATNTLNAAIERDPLRGFQAEDWNLEQWTITSAGALSLPTNTIPVWYLSARTNIATVYYASTGTLVTATAGYVRVSAGWRETIVDAGRYISSVRAYQPGAGGTNVYVGTLAQHYVDVSASPDAGDYTLVAPIDLADLRGAVVSNQMGTGLSWDGTQWNVAGTSVAEVVYGTTSVTAYRGDWGAAVSNTANAAAATGTAAYVLAAAAATGAPLYEVDLTPYATGTPLYAESYLGTVTGITAGGTAFTTGFSPEFVGSGVTATNVSGHAVTWTITAGAGAGSGIVNTVNVQATASTWDAATGTLGVNTNDAAGSGDFLADGTVPMTGNLDMGAQSITNVSDIPGFATDAELLSAWATASNALTIAEAGGGMDPAIASNSFVGVDGKSTMLEALRIDAPAGLVITNSTASASVYIGNVIHDGSTHLVGIGAGVRVASGVYSAVGIGRSANAQGGIAVGESSYAAGAYDIAVGPSASAYLKSVAVGSGANAVNTTGSGVAAGYNTIGGAYGVAVGETANGLSYGTALGSSANAARYGVAVGRSANAVDRGIAFGASARGTHTNIAIGASSYAGNSALHTNRVAIGTGVSNSVNDSVALRGDLYLDGGTGLYARATFGTGAFDAGFEWSGVDGTNEVFAVDGAGNRTQLSAHDGMTHIARSENRYAGLGRTINLDALAEAVQELTGRKDIISYYEFDPASWDAEQTAKVAESVEARAAWSNAVVRYSDDIAAWNSLKEDKREGKEPPAPLGDIPPLYIARPKPGWLVQYEERVK